jgi:hypothetical protein
MYLYSYFLVHVERLALGNKLFVTDLFFKVEVIIHLIGV